MRDMMKWARMMVSVLALLGGLLGQGQGGVTVRQPPLIPPDTVLTLAQCIDLALANQSSIRLAQAQIQAQSGAVRQANAALLPQPSLTASTQLAGNSGNGGTQYTLSANQLVFNFGRSQQLLAQAALLRTGTRYNLAASNSDTIFAVKQDYYTLLEDSHLVDVFQQALTQQQAHVAETRAQEAAGTVPHATVLTAEAAAASAQFDLITAQNNAVLARVTLANQMGIDVRGTFCVAETEEPALPLPNENDADALALARRPELRRDAADVRAAQAGVKAAATGNLPAIVASANYSPNPGATGFGQSQSWALVLNLQWNFFDFGATAGAVQTARAQVTTAQENLYTDRETISTQVEQARQNIIAAQAQQASAKAEVASAQANLQAALGSYRAGVGIFLNVIDAQAALLKAQVDEYTANYGLSIARAALQHALGEAVP